MNSMILPASLAIGLIAAPVLAAEPKPPVPLASPGEWISSNDYPAEALFNNVEGSVGFLLDIDRNGEPVRCNVTISSGSDQLDSRACNLIMLRARFAPGTDRRGRPTAGTYTNKVRWQIPATSAPDGPGLLITSFVVEPDGSVTDCKVESVEGSMTARMLKGRVDCPRAAFSEGYRDAGGEPVRKRVRTIVRIELTKP